MISFFEPLSLIQCMSAIALHPLPCSRRRRSLPLEHANSPCVQDFQCTYLALPNNACARICRHSDEVDVSNHLSQNSTSHFWQGNDCGSPASLSLGLFSPKLTWLHIPSMRRQTRDRLMRAACQYGWESWPTLAAIIRRRLQTGHPRERLRCCCCPGAGRSSMCIYTDWSDTQTGPAFFPGHVSSLIKARCPPLFAFATNTASALSSLGGVNFTCVVLSAPPN